jgi:toxin YoeB
MPPISPSRSSSSGPARWWNEIRSASFHEAQVGLDPRGLGHKTLRRINRLIADTRRAPFEGIGKPEALKENLAGFWSRRIDETNRLVYAVDETHLTIISCRYHYEASIG